MANLHMLQLLLLAIGSSLGGQPSKGAEVIDPEANGSTAPGSELARKAPTDADIAKIVDDAAKDIPRLRQRHAGEFASLEL